LSQDQIIDFLKRRNEKRFTAKEILELAGFEYGNLTTLHSNLKKLRNKKLVLFKKVSIGRNLQQYVYWINLNEDKACTLNYEVNDRLFELERALKKFLEAFDSFTLQTQKLNIVYEECKRLPAWENYPRKNEIIRLYQLIHKQMYELGEKI